MRTSWMLSRRIPPETRDRDRRLGASVLLPAVLTAETTGERALSWPPLRAALSDLVRRWELLAERAPDDRSRTRSGQVRSLLQELVAARNRSHLPALSPGSQRPADDRLPLPPGQAAQPPVAPARTARVGDA
jgi:hypothetical protein